MTYRAFSSKKECNFVHVSFKCYINKMHSDAQFRVWLRSGVPVLALLKCTFRREWLL